MGKTTAAAAAASTDCRPGDGEPATKKPKGIQAFFSPQMEQSDSACKFVVKHHESVQPKGFKLLRQGAADLKKNITQAMEAEEWDKAEDLQSVEKELLSAAELEENLYLKAVYCKQHAKNRYDICMKQQNVKGAKYFSTVLKAAESYLKKVPEADFENSAGPINVEDDDVLSVDNECEGESIAAAAPEEEPQMDEDDEGNETANEDEEDRSAESSSLRNLFSAGNRSKAGRKRKGRAYERRAKGSAGAPKRVARGSKASKITQAQLKTMKKKKYKATVPNKERPGTFCTVVVDMKNEPFWEISNGHLFCGCCNVVVTRKRVAEHCCGSKHKERRDNKPKEDAEAKEAGIKVQARLTEEGLQGSTVDADERKDHMLLMRAFARGNVPLRGADAMAPFLEQWSGKQVPGRRVLGELFTDLHKFHLEKIVKKIQECFPEFALIIDGSPFFANAECVIVRLVDRDFNIVELVIHLELYDSALDAEAICDHIISTIEDRMKSDPKSWRAVMLDRAYVVARSPKSP
mmetsp:Transcript_16893/g.36715  ORF Transcript_16893/g.36715 Transcript_16893/m.36715 type:complete len:520 (-) Transcript_16893:171-1730(-)